jgi:D-amino-acid dehydrogenase
MRAHGCHRVEKSAGECLEIEPALRNSAAPIVGGTYTADDESGDARKFTPSLAERCRRAGVRFRFDAAVAALDVGKGRIAGVRLDSGEVLAADAVVVALGSYAPLLLNRYGVRVPIYPAKGYSITVPVREDSNAPTVSLTDDGHKLVFSRLGDRLRVAGTAEFTGYDASVHDVRCAAIERRARQLFPRLPEASVELWAGLRPATPGNVPLVGSTRVENLYVNGGHGTLGWTMACGSARALTDIVGGKAPEIDVEDYRPD